MIFFCQKAVARGWSTVVARKTIDKSLSSTIDNKQLPGKIVIEGSPTDTHEKTIIENPMQDVCRDYQTFNYLLK